jgi:outer membrane protein
MAIAAVAILACLSAPVCAESLDDAMASAYLDNMELNAARASLRATDENVPLAVSAFRPTISGAGSAAWSWQRSNGVTSVPFCIPLSPGSAGPVNCTTSSGSTSATNTQAISVLISQPIFEGFRLINGLKSAKTGVRAARYNLQVTEQGVLQQAVQAFMDVVQDQVILNDDAQNVEYLRKQLEGANESFKSGEGTRTDVAQARARLSRGMTDYSEAKSTFTAALAAYLKIVGHKPKNLTGVGRIEHLLPKTLEAAIELGLHDNPAVLAAVENVDVSSYQVKILEGALLPTLSISGSASHSVSSGIGSDNAAVVASLSVPIYEGGRDSTEIRQAKEILGQVRIELDLTRATIRQDVVDAWAALEAARSQVGSAQAEVAANQLAFEGVTEEQKAGQRTLLDLLNAQQELLTSKEALVRAQHDRVVQASTLLAAVGDLNPEFLRLNVPIYDPKAHYKQVKDDWRGLRTPDGR